MIAKVDEAAGSRDGDALARRQMIERRLEALPRHHVAMGREAVDKHSAARVDADKRDLREPVNFGQRVSKREQGGINVRCDA